MNRAIFFLIGVLALSPLSAAHAQLLDTGQRGDAEAEARIEVGATGTASSRKGDEGATAESRAELNAETQTETRANLGGTRTTAESETDASATLDLTGDADAVDESAEAREESAEALVIIGSEVRAQAAENSAELRAYDAERNRITITPSEVVTSQRLKAFAEATAAVDANVESATVSEERVEIRYRMPAKLFGFIETTLPVRASVALNANAEGSAEVAYPWYAFLFSSAAPESDVQARIASGVADAPSLGQTEARAEAKLRQQAEALSRLHGALSASAAVHAEASADAAIE